MEELIFIKDAEIDANKEIKERKAARAILVDENGLVPMLFVGKHKYHKLPGGGIDEGENINQALVRECLEEVGCEIEVLGEVGIINEFRSKWDLKQTSYCYFGKIISKGEPNFTKKELSQNFQIVWKSLADCIKLLESDKPDEYEGKFIVQRDLTFLRKYKQLNK